jgi:hypothetical protein
VSDEAVIREAFRFIDCSRKGRVSHECVDARHAGESALDRLVARLEAAERERDEANSSWEQAHRGTLKIAEAWHSRAETAEAALAEARAALRAVAVKQPEMLAVIEHNGFVFEDIGREPGNWQHLAFTLYTALCELESIASATLAAAGETAASEPDTSQGTAEERADTAKTRAPGSLAAGDGAG